ncbi:MAG: hypothetical protein QXO03_03715, partial [Thermoplasmatales archaeon]
PDLAKIFIGSSSVVNSSLAAKSFLNSIDVLFYLSTAISLLAIIPSALRGKKTDHVNLIEK